jgi:hypothetical protein
MGRDDIPYMSWKNKKMFQTTNQLLFGDSELIVFECFLYHQTVDNYFSIRKLVG